MVFIDKVDLILIFISVVFDLSQMQSADYMYMIDYLTMATYTCMAAKKKHTVTDFHIPFSKWQTPCWFCVIAMHNCRTLLILKICIVYLEPWRPQHPYPWLLCNSSCKYQPQMGWRLLDSVIYIVYYKGNNKFELWFVLHIFRTNSQV